MEKTIIQSATKITLLALVIALVLLVIFSGIWGTVHGTLDPKEILAVFAPALTFVLGHYFGKTGSNTPIAG